MPFESEAQRRYLWSQKPEVAKEFAKKTPKGKALPKKVSADKKDYKIENKGYHKAMTEIRRSSAASPQESSPNRERSRADGLRASIKRSRDEWD